MIAAFMREVYTTRTCRRRIGPTERSRDMSNRQQEAWGGEVHMPRWVRRALRRPGPPANTPEAAHEARKPAPGPSVGKNADQAAVGALSELYREGRRNKRR
jgi:hypothetical protein